MCELVRKGFPTATEAILFVRHVQRENGRACDLWLQAGSSRLCSTAKEYMHQAASVLEIPGNTTIDHLLDLLSLFSAVGYLLMYHMHRGEKDEDFGRCAETYLASLKTRPGADRISPPEFVQRDISDLWKNWADKHAQDLLDQEATAAAETARKEERASRARVRRAQRRQARKDGRRNKSSLHDVFEDETSKDEMSLFLCPLSKVDHVSCCADLVRTLKVTTFYMQALMTDPVVAADGHTYQRSAMQDWMQHNAVSPVTHEKLGHARLYPNMVIKNCITACL